MKRFLKQWGLIILAIVTWGGLEAFSGTIHTFANGEALTASNLNQPLQHIHNTMVGGHGARLVDADVSASASVSHAKLATPALVPKAWALVASTCSSSPCTIAASSGVTSITRSSEGVYVVNLTTTRANANYAPFISGVAGAATAANVAVCTVTSIGTSSFQVECFENDAGGVEDTGMSVMIMDNDNT